MAHADHISFKSRACRASRIARVRGRRAARDVCDCRHFGGFGPRPISWPRASTLASTVVEPHCSRHVGAALTAAQWGCSGWRELGLAIASNGSGSRITRKRRWGVADAAPRTGVNLNVTNLALERRARHPVCRALHRVKRGAHGITGRSNGRGCMSRCNKPSWPSPRAPTRRW